MHITIKTFEELSKKELYELLALRSEVFVVEQECAYQDVDGQDEIAHHLLCVRNNELVAYLRIFNNENIFKKAVIGRVLVKKSARNQGLAQAIMNKAMVFVWKKKQSMEIELSAQSYLIKFYENLGFSTTGEEYLEDGIPHIKMIAQPNS